LSKVATLSSPLEESAEKQPSTINPYQLAVYSSVAKYATAADAVVQHYSVPVFADPLKQNPRNPTSHSP
jgi:hypothetical protein